MAQLITSAQNLYALQKNSARARTARTTPTVSREVNTGNLGQAAGDRAGCRCSLFPLNAAYVSFTTHERALLSQKQVWRNILQKELHINALGTTSLLSTVWTQLQAMTSRKHNPTTRPIPSQVSMLKELVPRLVQAWVQG